MARLVYRDVEADAEHTVQLDPAAPPITIGRTEEVTLRIRNASVSRRHALVWFADGRWQIKDQNSSNGTSVNDAPLTSTVPLADGDAIKVGEVEMWFYDGSGVSVEPPRPRTRALELEEPADEPRRETSRAPRPVVLADPPAPLPVMPSDNPRGGTSAMPRPNAARRAHLRPAPEPAVEPLPLPDDLPPSLPHSPTRTPQPDANRAVRTKSRVQRLSLRDADGIESNVVELQDELSRVAERAQRAEQERDELRQKAAQRGGEGARELARQLEKLQAERNQLESDLTEQRSVNLDLSAQVRDLEQRNVRYSVELESVTERYVRVREQQQHQKQRLDEAREQISDYEERIADLERELQKAQHALETLERSTADATQFVTELKIRVSQKDRQIEELQNQVDHTQYELRAARDEVDAMVARYDRDGDELNQLERKTNNLREVISDKENVITQLRRDLEEKDREILQVRMGVGIADLEEERRKLLEDFYIKNREVNQLRDKVAELARERDEARSATDELAAKIEAAHAELHARSQMPVDITDHPDYKEKLRLVARLGEEADEARVNLARAEARLSEFPPEEHRRLGAELALARKQLEQAHERVARAAQEAEDTAQSSEALEAFRGNLLGRYELLQENFISMRSNVSLFKSYVRDIEKAVLPLHQIPVEAMNPDVRHALDSADVGGAVQSFEDLIRVVEDEADLLKRELVNFRNFLES